MHIGQTCITMKSTGVQSLVIVLCSLRSSQLINFNGFTLLQTFNCSKNSLSCIHNLIKWNQGLPALFPAFG